MLTEKHRWKILGDHFKTKGFVHHQTESFNHFLNLELPRIITEEPPIKISRQGSSSKERGSVDYESYTIQFSDLYIPKPTVTEEDRSLRNFCPGEARQRDLTYDSPVYVNVTTAMDQGDGSPPEVERHMRVVIGRIPIMLRSSHCYLTSMTPSDRIKAGECEYDSGGYFVVKGKERVLIPQLRGVYNIPLVLKRKARDKFKYVAEIRSMSEETGHSVLLQALIGADDRTLVFSLPYIKEHIPIGVVFKALGYVRESQIRDLIGLDCDLTHRYIRLIIRDAFFCEEESDGLPLFMKQDDEKESKEQRSPEDLEDIWAELDDDEKRSWKDKMTRDNALRYIGRFTLHTLKEEDRRAYALQVVESELFPHMGIASTPREKAYLLGNIVNRLLSTSVGMRKDDDRDDYRNKRVESAGVLYRDLFRQLFKKFTVAIVSSIEKKKQNPDAMTVISRLPIITNGLRHCFGTGNWGVPKNSYIRSGVAQILSRLSYGATLSNLRRVTIPVGKESKNTKIRQIHPSQIMYICPSECFDPETEIFMWDGTIKKAKNIVVGDILVDDLGNATKVRKTCSGFKNMYDVIPDKANFTKHRVTDNHILTLRIRQHKTILKVTKNGRRYTHMVKFLDRKQLKIREKYFCSIEETKKFISTFQDDDTIDITIEDYLKLEQRTKDLLVLFKTDGIYWPKKEISMDPYLLGMWLGDGLSNGKGFAYTDHETLEYWQDWAAKKNAVIRNNARYSFTVCSKVNVEATHTDGMCNRIESNPLKDVLRSYNLIANKHIPSDFIVNDRETRLKVLAGLIDTDGSVRANGREIRITQGPSNYRIIDDAHKLSISLGFSCGIREGRSQWTDKKSGKKKFSTYKELTITGPNIHEIPTLLPRKKIVPVDNKTQLQRGRSSKFKLKNTGIGPYVGWQLEDKRGRFTLKDGLVVHNTPEGQPVGIVLNLSLLTRISARFPTVLVKEVVEECEVLIALRDFDGPNDKTKVFLNGSLIGMTDDSDGLLEEIIDMRSMDMLPYDVSVSYDDIDDELHVLSDDGRLLRPVFTVDGDVLNAKEEDGTDWDTLVKKGSIRYLDNSEINNAVVAFDQNELKKYHNDYCEIAPAMMLGVMASIIPFPDHSQSPRNCYQAAMGKQAMSMFALSYLVRTDTITHVLSYPQKPLVSTHAANMMGFSEMPSGINTVVAIACYSGFNQEDSIILNKGAVDRGLFWAATYRTHSEVEKKRGTYNFEKIGTPPLDKRRGDANYSLLDEHGIVRLRHPVYTDDKGKKCGGGAVFVQKGDVLIGKIVVQSNKSGDEELSDNSLVLRKGEDGYVDRIFISTTPNGYKLVKVVICKVRIPEVGDKFASRSAQKGTCGMIYPQEDMPWTRDGISPDLIMNPHALPSRMTINQLMESVLGKSCCIDGKLGDATPFTSSSVNIAETLCDCLGMNKFERTGKEMLYNGMTGEPMGMVFIGTVYYQRLKHLVDDKIHARAQGPNATLTRQPLEGRSRDGGLRFGEMERDCMMGHGASRFLKERLCDMSDPYTATICSKCGNFSTSKSYCKACDADQITQVNLPYVSKLVIQELNAMLIKCKITAKGEEKHI